MSAQLKGLQEALQALNRLDNAFAGKALETAALSGILPIQNAAKQNAPYRTGTLRRSIHEEVMERGDRRVVVSTGTDVVYAPIHEFGGVITPKTARALFFEIDGQFVMTQRVDMPARPYMRPAFDNKKGAAEREVGQALLALLKRAT